MKADEIINKMNFFGMAGKPFFFIVDYLCNYGFVFL